jgi:ubiquitin carboxyl-terminal hydrolase 4/11/15
VAKNLVFHLKRFKDAGGYDRTKNCAYVDFPQTLDLAPFLLSPGAPETYFINENTEDQSFKKPAYWQGFDECKSTNYKLYGVVNHTGSISGGHYYSFIENDGKWFNFNDSDLYEVKQFPSVVTKDAYMLFYRRED